MITIESSVQHCLGQKMAVVRLRELIADLSQRFPQQVHQVKLNINAHVMNVSFAAYGYVVHWSAEVFDDQVSLVGQIPDSAAPYESKMEQAVVARLEECLTQAVWARAA